MPADIEGPGGLWWLVFLNPGLLVVILGVFLLLALVAGIAGLVIYRRARRDARIPPVLLLLQLQTAPPGPRREVLRLRLRLQRGLLRARRAIAASATEGRAAGDLAGLLERAERAAAVIDRDLRIGPPDDRAALRDWAQRARARVAAFEDVTDRLAGSASVTLAGEADATLGDLRTDADRELLSLTAGVEALEGIDGRRLAVSGEDPSGELVARKR